ncbi:MAG: hypothetical protein V7767_12630 [Leeuwenhoekiella sp.]
MKVNILKSKQNSRFNYTPRYYKGKDIGNPYAFDSKFNKYRDATNANDYRAQWTEARKSSRNRGNRVINRTIVYIIIILIFLFLYIIDFDLSIFSQPK